jgi:hypothetical protein
MYCSVSMTTDMTGQTEMNRQLRCKPAVGTLPHLNACTHLATVEYCRARSSNSRHSPAISGAENSNSNYDHSSILLTSASEQGRQHNDVCARSAGAPLYMYPLIWQNLQVSINVNPFLTYILHSCITKSYSQK